MRHKNVTNPTLGAKINNKILYYVKNQFNIECLEIGIKEIFWK